MDRSALALRAVVRAGAAALALAVVATGCSSSEPDHAVTSQPLVFPTTYNAVPQFGVGIGDVNGDGGQGSREVVGSPQFPAVYMAVHDGHMFVRLRLNATPLAQNGNLQQFGWGILIDTDGDLAAYEYALILDASGNPNRIIYSENTVKTGGPRDRAENLVAQVPVALTPPNHNVEVIPADSCFGQVAPNDPTCNTNNDRDYFLTFGFPLDSLCCSPNLQGAGIDLTTPIRVVAGTSSEGTSLRNDIAGVDQNQTSNPNLGDIMSDVITIDGTAPCGNGVLQADEGCDDGNTTGGGRVQRDLPGRDDVRVQRRPRRAHRRGVVRERDLQHRGRRAGRVRGGEHVRQRRARGGRGVRRRQRRGRRRVQRDVPRRDHLRV